MTEFYTQGFSDSYVNARGIPRVEFISDVTSYLKAKDCSVESLLAQMQERYSKYKLMEYKLSQTKASLKSKLPEIKKTLEMVRCVKAKVESDEALETYFGLSENVYVSAAVKHKPKTCGLWLGANVMVEYSHEEALQLLEKNFKSATENLNHVLEDLAFLRDQLTISEVNIARVYNYEVKQKRLKQQTTGGAGASVPAASEAGGK
eukprot:RCo024536